MALLSAATTLPQHLLTPPGVVPSWRLPHAGDDPHLARAVKLVGQMTLREKMGFIQGNQSLDSGPHGSYVGVVPGVPRLGIPDLRMNDGPEGFRGQHGTSTQWPSGLTVAHTWDPSAFLAWGTAMVSVTFVHMPARWFLSNADS
jgi:beta-glucosidase